MNETPESKPWDYMTEFTDEFVLYTGEYCEPVWQDAEGSVGPVKAFIHKVAQHEREEGKKEMLSKAIETLTEFHRLSESKSSTHECSQEGYEYGLKDAIEALKSLKPNTDDQI